MFAVGFLSYEASAGLNPELKTHQDNNFPLCWFGLYTERKQVIPGDTQYDIGNIDWQPGVTTSQYHESLKKLKEYIGDGETYQVNYTYPLKAQRDKFPEDYFWNLIEAQGESYGTYIELPDWKICSASPELFFSLKNNQITCKPMKGTAPRHESYEKDDFLKSSLQESTKDRAENLMIVDMVRNDLGKIAKTGSVNTSSLFDIEKHPTVWQMTSNISCQTNAGLTEIMRALFPAASITGAPKCRTMEIINELENSPRKIYTGTMGYYAPDRTAQFNIAIRTLLYNKNTCQAEYGIGGGIVWDSEPDKELQESLDKARILTYNKPDFQLLESLLFEKEKGYWLLDRHISRLKKCADYFNYPIDIDEIKTQLDQFASKLDNQPHKVRLLVNQQGKILLQNEPVSVKKRPATISLAAHPVNKNNVFLYHKTTRRQVYDNALKNKGDADEILLWNEEGEITEATTSNIVIVSEGQLYTPPIKSGLLAGTYRQELIERKEIKEKIIQLNEIRECETIYLINSVRGMWQVRLI